MSQEKLQRIVVGTDFNELATAALTFASGIAARSGAELTVVYADRFEPPAEFTSSQVRTLVDAIERSTRKAREQLEQHVARHVPQGVKVETAVIDGAAAGSLVRIAAERNADLIALGTHGRGGLERLMIGSVAETVIRDATVPVLTVRSAAAHRWVRRILCPVNDSEIAAIAVDRAAQFAAALGAELTLMHVVRAGAKPAFDVDKLKPAAVRTTIITRPVEHESAAAEILAAEESGEFDLLVIGAEHRLVRDVTMFGDTTASVTRHARTPVLTVTRTAARPEAHASVGGASHVV